MAERNLVELLRSISRGDVPPATITILSGDVHTSYVWSTIWLFLIGVGSGPDATCSTTVGDACTVLPMSSSAFAAVFLSCSAALLLKLFNMSTSPLRPV